MGQIDQHETYLRRSVECEALAKSARDVSIREKCAELAIVYRALADGTQQSERSGTTDTDVRPGRDSAGQMLV